MRTTNDFIREFLIFALVLVTLTIVLALTLMTLFSKIEKNTGPVDEETMAEGRKRGNVLFIAWIGLVFIGALLLAMK